MGKLYYGAALYPELWDKGTVTKDIKHMHALGMNLVRIGEFAWSTFEPNCDEFDLSILDFTVNEAYSQNIDTIVCIPTATPPIWMTHGFEERLHHDEYGKAFVHGSRQHICTNNEYFRNRSVKITEKIAEKIKDLPGVVAVQLDNEFKSHVGPCYCGSCKVQWQEWLEGKYHAVDNLNQAWGMDIWSQRYQDFSQVVQPKTTAFIHNSSLQRAYRQFSLEKISEFAHLLKETIQKHTDIPVTHNSSFPFEIDNEALFSKLDFVGFDTYAPISNHAGFMMNNDYWPFVKLENAEYMLLETSTSYSGHIDDYGKLHPKGYVEAEAFAAYASGSKGFNYWLFRGQKAGCEQPHGSVISSWGEPTIGYGNVIDVGKMKRLIEPHLNKTKRMPSSVAMTYSDRAKSFLLVEKGENYNYRTLTTNFYKKFVEKGIERRVIGENYPLSEMDVLFSPFIHYISDEFLEKGIGFVEKGGTWIVGPLSGDRTKEHTWHTSGGLGKLGEWAGLTDIMQFPATDAAVFGEIFNRNVELGMMTTLFKTKEGTVPVGTITKGQAAGYAFLAERKIGKGKLVILGSMPVGKNGDEVMGRIVENYSKTRTARNELVEVKSPVYLISRVAEDGTEQKWIVNFSEEKQPIILNEQALELLENKTYSAGEHHLNPFEYRILRRK